jgi:RND family efflux transporter MFP subunit
METTEHNRKSSKGKWLIFLTLCILAGLFILGWSSRLANNRRVNALAAENDVPRVTLMNLKPNTNPITLILPTSAQGLHFTPIWARVNGYLMRYLVDIGDRVKEGDLLAEIDTPETDQELGQAKATLENSIAERDIAKITSDRWQKLWDKNKEAVSKQEVDQYHANLQAAEATVQANMKNVERLTYEQQFKFVYAPFDGIITQRTTDIGMLVYGSLNGTPQELYQIARTDYIRFYVDVPQTYFRQIKVGLEAEINILQMPGKVFKGTVIRFAKALDPVARTLLTEIDVPNPGGVLYTGLYGQVKFLIYPAEMNFIIPTAAVIIRATKPQVAVVDQGDIVHLKTVLIGRDYGNQVEISSGLNEQDRIITVPTARIKEGVKVQILNPTSEVKKS